MSNLREFTAGETSTAPLATQNTFSNDQPGSNSTSNQGRGSFHGKGKGRGSGSNIDKSVQCQIDNLYIDEPPQQIQNTLQECKYAFQEVDPDAHADYVSCVHFSSSAQPPLFVSGSWDRTVKVWNAENLTLRYTLRGHKGRVNAVAISPDGSLCASGGDSCVIILWDLAEGRRLYSLDAGAYVHALCFCPSRYWLSVCAETSVQIWDLDNKVMQNFKPDNRPRKWKNHHCTRLDWSADGNTLFTGYSDGAIRVWRVAGGNY
ncbi:Guanine nucleotide-binding protein subunit beta-like protein [Rhynchospora pubera]|uniref:Guanine nucleotide-binding protein subunit beta-like protein n=1 Tax=Rhynchospora pubera TaxID=906938 RepID=A0AAV8DTM9_9POAL|nr:Guanine nucleotide-binding protein subunit beta-like protein [Rhynchospora pubera]